MRIRRSVRPFAVLVVAVGASVLPVTTAAMPAACAAEGARAGVVVDFGTFADAPAPEVHCVPVAAGGNGFDVLEGAGHSVRLNSAGLVCAIDGYPATGCGTRTDDGYRYWSYWHGDAAGWRYAAIGPGTHRPSQTVVEGWRFVQGAGNASDPAPRGPSDPSRVCPPPPATTPPPPVPTSAPVATVPATTAPVAPDQVGGPAASQDPAPDTSGLPPTPEPAPPTTSGDAVVAPDAGVGATDAADPTVEDATGGDERAGGVAVDQRSGDVGDLAAAPAAQRSAGGGGVAGLVAAVAVIALLGGAAARRSRRREPV